MYFAIMCCLMGFLLLIALYHVVNDKPVDPISYFMAVFWWSAFTLVSAYKASFGG